MRLTESERNDRADTSGKSPVEAEKVEDKALARACNQQFEAAKAGKKVYITKLALAIGYPSETKIKGLDGFIIWQRNTTVTTRDPTALFQEPVRGRKTGAAWPNCRSVSQFFRTAATRHAGKASTHVVTDNELRPKGQKAG
ncbi:MAG TPA: hypothetical protein VEC35_20075 [Noviherbaspirillum sp.]|nr:hypothetical protein [Noviherbaspirillum sp.]